MPYIEWVARTRIEQGSWPRTAGELNWFITKAIWAYFQDTPKYQGINDVIGALEGAKLEFYRRVVVPYEDKKIIENGDVYV